jgi:hypothetical protein
MLPKFKRFKVEVKDSSQGEPRTFIITLRDSAKLIQLTDLQRQGKLSKPLQTQLKQAMKDSFEECVSAAKRLNSPPSSEPKWKLNRESGEAENDNMRRIVVRSLKVPTK